MTFPHGGAAQVFRDYTVDGVPASGAKQPDKGEIRDLLGNYETSVAAGITVTAATGVLPPLPLHTRAIVMGIGDSTWMQHDVGTIPGAYPVECSRQAKGPTNWAEALSQNSFDRWVFWDGGEPDSGKWVSGAGNNAFAAELADDVFNRLPRGLRKFAPDIVIGSYGINDITSNSTSVAAVQAAQAHIIATDAKIAALCLAAGAYFILMALPPRSGLGVTWPITGADFGWDKSSLIGQAEFAARLAVNAARASLAASSGGAVRFVDTDTVWHNASTDEWLVLMSEEGVHESQYASWLAGPLIKTHLDALIAPAAPFVTINDNLSYNFAPNINNTGTGGTVTGTGISGTVSDLMSFQRADSGTGISCVASKGTNGLCADGVTTLNTQVLTFTFGGTAAVETFWLSFPALVTRPNVPDGTLFQLLYLVTLNANGGWRMISPRLSVLDVLNPSTPSVLTETYCSEGMKTPAPNLYGFPNAAQTVWLKTHPVAVSHFTQSLNCRLQVGLSAQFSPTGQPVLTVQKCILRVHRDVRISSRS